MMQNKSRILVITAAITVCLLIFMFIVLGLLDLISLKTTLVFLGIILFIVMICVGTYFMIRKFQQSSKEEVVKQDDYDTIKVQEEIVKYIQIRYADRFEVIQVYPEQRLGSTQSPILRIYGYCVFTRRYCNVLMNMKTKKFGEVFSQDEKEVQNIMEKLAESPDRYAKIREHRDVLTGQYEKEEEVPFIEQDEKEEEVEKNG